MVEAIFSKILINVCHRSIKNTGQSATEMFRILQNKHEIVEEIELLCLFPVVPDVLDIVVIFHGVDELLHHDSLVLVQRLIVLGNHLNLGGDKGVLAQVCDHIVEVIGSGVDGFGC